MRRQTAVAAAAERRRGEILEDINGTEPLAEILEKITELVSFKLGGAPCWCQAADGLKLGNCPASNDGMRVAAQSIAARIGPSLGTLYAAFDAKARPDSDELGTLSMAGSLAALAIETRRLYSNLLRRSEFDQLTSAHNRFSLDKHLDDLIAGTRNEDGIFGLVYVDLDHFKQINDRYGHQAGDQYLQEVALRMKGQLRSVDTLARIGGDEFAVLLPAVRGRADVEEIALRLEQCFDEPFDLDDVIWRGSASVGIALYPLDAGNRDLLFRVADAAMYASKNHKRRIEAVFAGERTQESAQKHSV